MAQPAVKLLLFLALLFSLGGCQKPAPLEERVQAYWEARKKRDFATAYRFEDPKMGMDREAYIQRMKSGQVVCVSVRIKEIQKEGDRATVRLDMIYTIPPFITKNIRTTHTDFWFREDGGQWYHRMRFKKKKEAAEQKE